MTKWLRRKHLCARYGDVSERTVDNKIPAWRESGLDDHDRRLVKNDPTTVSPSMDETAHRAAMKVVGCIDEAMKALEPAGRKLMLSILRSELSEIEQRWIVKMTAPNEGRALVAVNNPA